MQPNVLIAVSARGAGCRIMGHGVTYTGPSKPRVEWRVGTAAIVQPCSRPSQSMFCWRSTEYRRTTEHDFPRSEIRYPRYPRTLRRYCTVLYTVLCSCRRFAFCILHFAFCGVSPLVAFRRTARATCSPSKVPYPYIHKVR